MNKRLTIIYRLSFCIFLCAFFNTIAYSQSNGTSLRNDITVEHVIEFPKEGFRNEPIRLVKDEVTGNLLYNEYGGTIWEIDITSPTPVFNFRYSAFDHNLPIVQGMTMHDDILYLVGNEEVNNGNDNVGIIAKGVRIDNNRREWTVIARTEPYLGKPETPFDHKMAGNAVSPDGQFIYVSTNSRTNHGEVAGLSREDDLNILILKIPTNPSSPIDLRNDKTWLRNNGYLYAEGIRNGFDMAFDNNGNLFEVENSGQRDDPEEMNWIREGRHYGFPYRLGGNDNPIITAGYDSNNDPLVPNDQKGTPLFAYDPNFPAPPAGVTFSEPIRNLGPDADLFRDPNTGAIRDASNEGSFITTFTAHRSPVGFGFDNANTMGGNFTGDAFMASFSGNTWPLIGGDSEDLLHIELNYNGALDNYDANVYKIATGFAQPIDIVVDDNIIWLAEYGDGVNRGLWKITLPCGNTAICGGNPPPPTTFSCDNIMVTGGQQQIRVSGLPATSVEVTIYNSSNELIFSCNNSCPDIPMLTGLAAGNYRVNVKAFDNNSVLVCEKTNIPAIVNSTPPPTFSCDDVNIVGGDAQINITGLTAPNEILQVFDANFNLVFRCEGGDCGDEQLIDNLSAEKHLVNIQFYDENFEFVCSLEGIPINVTGGTPSSNCDDLTIEGKEAQIAITNLTAPIEIVQVFDENYTSIFRCEGEDCGSEQFINDLSAGDYFVSVQFYTANWELICEETNVKVTVTGEINPPTGSADCNALVFTPEAGQISVTGLNTAYSQIQIIGRNTDWQVITICQGDCAETQIIPNLAVGEYAVKVQLNGADGTDCYREENITVSEDSNNSDCTIEIIAANFPNTVNPGETITIQATVRNNSTTLSANTTLGLYQFIGGNAFFPSPQLIGETPTNGFQPNETRVITFSVQLPDPLFNTALLPIGSSSVTNNFILLTGENTGIIEAQKCNFPIDFDIDYPDADLALSFENNQHCIDTEGVVNVDLKVTNAGNTFVKAPIYILLDDNCSFVNQTNVICQPFTNVAYYKLDQDLPVGTSFTIPKPFKVPNTQITEWNYSPSIAATASNIEDINTSNNSVSATFTQTTSCGENSTVDCNQIQTSSSGNQITIANLTAPIEIVQVFDQNYQLVYRCQGTDCGSEQTINDLAAGNYFVNVQFYTADWKFICAKENIVVEVGGGGSCEEAEKTGFTFLGKMDNKSFYLSDNRLPFNDAKQACVDAGSQLATSLTTATIDFLKNNIEGEAFLDLTDANNEGNFQWADGSTYNATIFDNNATNDYAFVANWATDLVATSEGAWKNFVCEVPCLVFGESRATSKGIEKAIKLFPNPAQSIINLQVLPLMDKKGRIQIFNIYGQLVQQFDQLHFNTVHQQLEIPNFENGLYLLTIQADNMPLISKRFVVEHWR